MTTKPDPESPLDRLRRLEWKLARDERGEELASVIRDSAHDLMNLVQIIDIASSQIGARITSSASPEIILELAQALVGAAGEAKMAVSALTAHAEPVEADPSIRCDVGEVADRMPTATVRVEPNSKIAWHHDDFELLLVGLALDVPGGEVLVRTRRVVGDGVLVEVVCGPVTANALAIRLARALTAGERGEVTVEERRGGDFELVVAIPRLA